MPHADGVPGRAHRSHRPVVDGRRPGRVRPRGRLDRDPPGDGDAVGALGGEPVEVRPAVAGDPCHHGPDGRGGVCRGESGAEGDPDGVAGPPPHRNALPTGVAAPDGAGGEVDDLGALGRWWGRRQTGVARRLRPGTWVGRGAGIPTSSAWAGAAPTGARRAASGGGAVLDRRRRGRGGGRGRRGGGGGNGRGRGPPPRAGPPPGPPPPPPPTTPPRPGGAPAPRPPGGGPTMPGTRG